MRRWLKRGRPLWFILAAVLWLPGCATTMPTDGVLQRLFPVDPDESFLGDEAREIDKRLSSSSPRVQL